MIDPKTIGEVIYTREDIKKRVEELENKNK